MLKIDRIPETIEQSIFRAYDIRGIVNETLTPDSVFAIGMAVGSEAQAQGHDHIVIGRDGRLSGPQLARALSEGLLASGCHVIDIGEVPTPVLYYATHALGTDSGVMLTGSHNPPDYNGLKIIIAGKTLAEDDIQALYQRIINKHLASGAGVLKQRQVIADYVARIVSDIQLQRPLKVVIDCGNGVAGGVAPQLFKALGCEVIELFCDVDGHFPNHHPDPTEPANLQDLIATVKSQQADLGLGFDGDGDRVGVVTNLGEIIYADRQLMLFARDILVRHPGAEIIFDVKCSTHLPKFISQHGGKPVMWKTGHSLIKAKMQQLGALLAGEMSGHIFFKERWYGFDDGLYVAARLLEIIAAQSLTVSDVFKALPDSVNTPELKVAIAEENKFTFVQQLIAAAHFDAAEITTIDGLRVDFKDGWGLVRPSNTTPYLILRFEADSEQRLKQIQAQFRQQMCKVDPNLVLPF